jgi:hypothetical protein
MQPVADPETMTPELPPLPLYGKLLAAQYNSMSRSPLPDAPLDAARWWIVPRT